MFFNKKTVPAPVSYLVIRNGYKGIQAERRIARKLKYTGDF